MHAPQKLSVVVGLISGKKSDLERCLRALHTQSLALELEILVPYDDPCAEVTSLAAQFPAVRFLRAEGLDTAVARAGASREHHDTLRTLGLRAASGDVIALTEDHAHTANTWCAEMVAALEQVESVWRGDYHETAVHWAMVEAGFELCTTPRVVVWQARGELALGAALRERFVWARSFAGTRARMSGAPKRWIWAVASPVLPFLMTARLARTAFGRGAHKGRFLAALPLIALLQCVWALGEFVGYVSADPG